MNSDYSPFGMVMPARSYSVGSSYRYGFNGKEKDKDISSLTAYDYGFRIYNPAIGRFLSMDPLVRKYPMLTPYQFASNMPTIAIDLDGEEAKIVTIYHSMSTGKEFYRVVQNDNSVFHQTLNITTTVHMYAFNTRKGFEWLQLGPAELTFNRPVNFQTGRIDLSSQTLGKLSERFESHGVGTVSSGDGDAGGVSYGNWQLATNRRRPQEFLQSEGKKWESEFGDNAPGTKEFSETWKTIAKREPDAFKDAQHAFIKRTHYDAMASNLNNTVGLDVSERSATLQDVVWSTAVQHGPGNDIFQTALAGKDIEKLSDADIIKLVYAERGRKDDDGNLVHFSHSSKKVQRDVSSRFKKEEAAALQQLGNK